MSIPTETDGWGAGGGGLVSIPTETDGWGVRGWGARIIVHNSRVN